MLSSECFLFICSNHPGRKRKSESRWSTCFRIVPWFEQEVEVRRASNLDEEIEEDSCVYAGDDYDVRFNNCCWRAHTILHQMEATHERHFASACLAIGHRVFAFSSFFLPALVYFFLSPRMCHRRTRMTRGRLLQPCSMIFLPNVQPFGEFLLVHFFQASLPSKSKLWMENVEKSERWRICFYFPTRVMFQVACQFLRV